jgi:predicted aminopeptidase
MPTCSATPRCGTWWPRPSCRCSCRTWCFPVMGCVGYRGYFDRAGRCAGRQLKARGLEVSVYGVPAYSTLGWTNWLGGDPLLNTFITWPEGELARLIFHELAHQVAYASRRHHLQRKLCHRGGTPGRPALAGHARRPRVPSTKPSRRRDDFRALMQHSANACRRCTTARWATTPPSAAQGRADGAVARRVRALKRERWGGFAGYDGAIARANNASFGVQAAYNDLVPAFERCSNARAATSRASMPRCSAWPRCRRPSAARRSVCHRDGAARQAQRQPSGLGPAAGFDGAPPATCCSRRGSSGVGPVGAGRAGRWGQATGLIVSSPGGAGNGRCGLATR